MYIHIFLRPYDISNWPFPSASSVRLNCSQRAIWRSRHLDAVNLGDEYDWWLVVQPLGFFVWHVHWRPLVLIYDHLERAPGLGEAPCAYLRSFVEGPRAREDKCPCSLNELFLLLGVGGWNLEIKFDWWLQRPRDFRYVAVDLATCEVVTLESTSILLMVQKSCTTT